MERERHKAKPISARVIGGKDGGGWTGAEAVERGGGMGKEEEMKGRGSNV